MGGVRKVDVRKVRKRREPEGEEGGASAPTTGEKNGVRKGVPRERGLFSLEEKSRRARAAVMPAGVMLWRTAYRWEAGRERHCYVAPGGGTYTWWTGRAWRTKDTETGLEVDHLCLEDSYQQAMEKAGLDEDALEARMDKVRSMLPGLMELVEQVEDAGMGPVVLDKISVTRYESE
jgi:hypothetical protein